MNWVCLLIDHILDRSSWRWNTGTAPAWSAAEDTAILDFNLIYNHGTRTTPSRNPTLQLDRTRMAVVSPDLPHLMPCTAPRFWACAAVIVGSNIGYVSDG